MQGEEEKEKDIRKFEFWTCLQEKDLSELDNYSPITSLNVVKMCKNIPLFLYNVFSEVNEYTINSRKESTIHILDFLLCVGVTSSDFCLHLYATSTIITRHQFPICL